LTTKKFSRSVKIDRNDLDEAARTIDLSVSSEDDSVVRWVPGIGEVREVLGHKKGEINLSRFEADTGGPLLYNHNFDDLIGRFAATGLSGGKLRGTARFAKDEKSERLWKQLKDGILVDVSITYSYDHRDVEVIETNADGTPRTVRVKHWTPYEVSFVTVPADATVGVGRSWRSDED
jgi:HK97 family phage prohead protease